MEFIKDIKFDYSRGEKVSLTLISNSLIQYINKLKEVGKSSKSRRSIIDKGIKYFLLNNIKKYDINIESNLEKYKNEYSGLVTNYNSDDDLATFLAELSNINKALINRIKSLKELNISLKKVTEQFEKVSEEYDDCSYCLEMFDSSSISSDSTSSSVTIGELHDIMKDSPDIEKIFKKWKWNDKAVLEKLSDILNSSKEECNWNRKKLKKELNVNVKDFFNYFNSAIKSIEKNLSASFESHKDKIANFVTSIKDFKTADDCEKLFISWNKFRSKFKSMASIFKKEKIKKRKEIASQIVDLCAKYSGNIDSLLGFFARACMSIRLLLQEALKNYSNEENKMKSIFGDFERLFGLDTLDSEKIASSEKDLNYVLNYLNDCLSHITNDKLLKKCAADISDLKLRKLDWPHSIEL